VSNLILMWASLIQQSRMWDAVYRPLQLVD
jgi:hypothetical protein